MDAALDKGPPPFELIEIGLCERFHKIPEELDGIDWSRLLTGVEVLDVFNAFKKFKDGEKLHPGEMQTFREMTEADLERQVK